MMKQFTPRKKRSVIWQIPLEELKTKVEQSTSLGEILRNYGLINKGGNSRTLKERLIAENINFDHIKLGVDSNKGRKFWDSNKMTKEECLQHLFVKNSKFVRKTAKFYAIYYSLIPYTCSECSLGIIWNSKPLSLHLDHKNGISNDHRLENLRFLCPNCHTQTETYSGKRRRYLFT